MFHIQIRKHIWTITHYANISDAHVTPCSNPEAQCLCCFETFPLQDHVRFIRHFEYINVLLTVSIDRYIIFIYILIRSILTSLTLTVKSVRNRNFSSAVMCWFFFLVMCWTRWTHQKRVVMLTCSLRYIGKPRVTLSYDDELSWADVYHTDRGDWGAFLHLWWRMVCDWWSFESFLHQNIRWHPEAHMDGVFTGIRNIDLTYEYAKRAHEY